MKKVLMTALMLLFASPMAWPYDTDMAKSYEQYFTQFSGKNTAKALRMMPTEDFIKAVKSGERLYVLDVRTKAETNIYGMNMLGAMAIPMDEVFRPHNLARIPTDRKVVVVCKAGHRAMAIATGLRHIGFDNIFVLKKGIEDVAQYLSPKNAY